MSIPDAKPRVAPPAGLGTCSQCRWFVGALAVEVAVMDANGNAMPRAQYDAGRRAAIASGNSALVPKALAFLRSAPCARHPAWAVCPESHWCGEWRRREASDWLQAMDDPGVSGVLGKN